MFSFLKPETAVKVTALLVLQSTKVWKYGMLIAAKLMAQPTGLKKQAVKSTKLVEKLDEKISVKL